MKKKPNLQDILFPYPVYKTFLELSIQQTLKVAEQSLKPRTVRIIPRASKSRKKPKPSSS